MMLPYMVKMYSFYEQRRKLNIYKSKVHNINIELLCPRLYLCQQVKTRQLENCFQCQIKVSCYFGRNFIFVRYLPVLLFYSHKYLLKIFVLQVKIVTLCKTMIRIYTCCKKEIYIYTIV